MNHLETQYIRFPTITKLFYDGDNKPKPNKDIMRTTRAKLTTNRQFYTNPSHND